MRRIKRLLSFVWEDSKTVETNLLRRPIPLTAIALLAIVVHAPFLFMELPLTTSYDANLHVFFASHYAHHWFNPWNEKWFAGFSQTTYPPLGHQWIAVFSLLVGLRMAYMLVQLAAIVLLAIGVYRFARLWVDERAASYAAAFSVFLGMVSFLVYSAGQLSTTLSAPIYLLALPYFYHWSRSADGRALLKGVVLVLAAASVHHVTLIFGSFLFALPVIWLACMDRKPETSVLSVLFRAAIFAVLAGIGVGAVLFPYWVEIIRHPIEQIPIPHASRSNLLLNMNYLINYFIVPYGALILAMPVVIWLGAGSRRLRPLMLGFWVALLLGLGGTTPVPKWLFGRAFEILTFERFTLSAALLALPIVGLIAASLIDRFGGKAAGALALASVLSMALAMGWLTWSPFHTLSGLNVNSVVEFLNRGGHDHYRYLTLGFGNALPKVSTYAHANSVDGEYNSARLLPEMTHYGSAQLTSSKFFGTAGMESLRAMLKHANNYGLKYIFVHDPYYEPMIAFAGWRQIESYDSGSITVWSKEDVPPARPIQSDAMPTPLEGLLWGTLPMGSSILAIVLAILLPDRHKARGRFVPFPVRTTEPEFAREVR
ncbi:MAG: hypothetical protein DMG91_02305 [Acidobacteria bacterium]|nr:MAG: hypothetical protein DMG91_02305 [Acidobacteriota bacterium]